MYVIIASYRIRSVRVCSMDTHSSHLTKFKLFEVKLKSGSIPCFFLISQRYVLRLLEFLVLIYYIFCGNLGYLFHKIHIFSGSVNTIWQEALQVHVCD